MAGSGTRFEVILPLWQKFLTLAKTFELLFSNLQHFEPTLANFYALGQFYIRRIRDSQTLQHFAKGSRESALSVNLIQL